MTSAIHDTINTGPMSGFQKQAVAICIVLMMLDGFDVLVMAFTAPSVSADWGLSGSELGLLLSAGLFGMAAGSLFLAPFADWYGRRALTLACLVVLTIGMALSSVARGFTELLLYRGLTGIGIGAMLASLSVITSEYSSDRWRSTNISLSATGYPVGATIGGSIAAVLIAHYGWRSVFVFGALTSAAMILLVAWRLPESLDFLLARRPANALDKLNALMVRMNRSTVASLPEPGTSTGRGRVPMTSLLAGPLLRPTLLIWSSFFVVMFAFYFVLSWTPKLLVTAGLSAQQGVTGGVLLNVGGIAGGTLFGLLAARFPPRALAQLFTGLTAGALALFGFLASQLATAFALAVGIGILLFGSMVGLYALTPSLYPAEIRTTGMGWAIGIGRIGAILSPMLVGVLIDGGWQVSHLYYAFVAPLMVAVLTVRALRV